MLWFIGLGLNSEKDLTLRGIEIAKKCSELYLENYTSIMANFSKDNLEKIVGKKVNVVGREFMENFSFRKKILLESRKKDIGILVPGEAMAATTHQIFRLEGKEMGVDIGIIHSSSIFTAAPSLLGLQNYKFGRATTIPKIREGYFPTSPYEVIENNKKMGLHTLVLLDTQPPITANEGLNTLIKLEEKLKRNVITEKTIICVVGNAGSFNPTIKCGNPQKMLSENFGPVPHTIVIPGKLHFTEAEILHKVCGCPKHLVEEYI